MGVQLLLEMNGIKHQTSRYAKTSHNTQGRKPFNEGWEEALWG
jgi:hypothetical protein